MNTSHPTSESIEELLAAAGFDFTMVDRCPFPACELCSRDDLPAAA